MAVLIAIFTNFAAAQPLPPGKLVDLGGHKLHVNCTGRGSPSVIVENGLGDFSFDWILVQSRVERFTRICTYDRGGYAWSDPGPRPRTFSQLNLELRDALAALGEQGPFVLVGHSFGGPVVRSFAATYPRDVVGMVLVDAVNEDQKVIIQGKAVRISDGAIGKSIPRPHEDMGESDPPTRVSAAGVSLHRPLARLYWVLPFPEQKLHLWAQGLPGIEDAENDQREWSTESLARMKAAPQEGSLGSIPLIVLSRARGGYRDDLDEPAAKLEQERKDGQRRLVLLSRNSKQIVVNHGHNMQLEAPGTVAKAVKNVVEAVRSGRAL